MKTDPAAPRRSPPRRSPRTPRASHTSAYLLFGVLFTVGSWAMSTDPGAGEKSRFGFHPEFLGLAMGSCSSPSVPRP